MLKVFLVEDEVVVREGIKNNIDWEAHGYEFCGEASDGELAFSMISSLRPDIVITDIRMPFMDGLTLSKLIKEQMPETEIIILTGYGEFDYAKEGIRIGVAEYLLKPVSGAELCEHVDRLAEKIMEKRRDEQLRETYIREMEEKTLRDRSEFLKELVSGTRSVSELLAMAKEQDIALAAPWYNFLLVKPVSNHQSQERFSGTLVKIEEELRTLLKEEPVLVFERNLEGKALLIKAQSEEELKNVTENLIRTMKELFEQYSHVTYFGGIGKSVSRISELSESFECAERAFAYRYLMSGNLFLDYAGISKASHREDKEPFGLENIDTKLFSRSKIEEFLRLGEAEETVYFAEEFLRGLGENALNSIIFRQYLVMDAYFCVADFVESISPGDRSRVETADPAGETVRTVDNTMQYLTRILQSAVDLRQQNASNRYRDVVKEVEDYITEHFADEAMSLNDIASHVNFSPNHLSTIFSQQTGHTLIKYLTDFRLTKAKELLRGTSKKSSEISLEVGYRDPHYFSYLFKKTQGMTPTQYREGRPEEEQ